MTADGVGTATAANAAATHPVAAAAYVSVAQIERLCTGSSSPVGRPQQHVFATCWCGVEEQPVDVLYTGRLGLWA